MVDGSSSGHVPVGEAANILDVTRRTLSRWRVNGIGPDHIERNGKTYYIEDSLNEWVADGDDGASLDGRLHDGFRLNYDGDMADATQIERDELGY